MVGIRNRAVLLLICALVMGKAVAESVEIEVVGLFKGAAVVAVNGQQHMLKVGQTSLEGVLLVSADSEKAVVTLNGESRTIYLSGKVASEFEQPKQTTVSIQRNNAGQYTVGGSINGRTVRFLVDTGANIVALSSVEAKRLGLDLEQGKQMQAITAAGVVYSHRVMLDSVQVGGISARNVDAAVLPGDYPPDVLLGMTFLERVVMREEKDVLMLINKF